MRRVAGGGPESAGDATGCHEITNVCARLVEAVVMIARGVGVLLGSVHPCDQAIDPGVVRPQTFLQKSSQQGNQAFA